MTFMLPARVVTPNDPNLTAADALRKIDEFINLILIQHLEHHDRVGLLFKVITFNLNRSAGNNITANFRPSKFVIGRLPATAL